MISLVSGMPLLRVGQHDVAHYEAHWLEMVIRRAAESAGHSQWWLAGDVARGVIEFLRERFQKNIITLQDLFSRLGQTLQGIGFGDIAERVRPEPPPMEVCLLELALESGPGFELLFFRRVSDELRELRELGATSLHCVRCREAIRHILGTETWNARCAAFECELVDFVGTAAARTNTGVPLALLMT